MNTIEQKKQLLDECLVQYINRPIKYTMSGISAYIPDDLIKRIINTAIVIRRIPTDIFSREVDSTITSINDERLVAFVEKHLAECIDDEPIDIVDEHQMGIVRDTIMARLEHWLDTGEADPLLDVDEAIVEMARNTARCMTSSNPDKAIRYMLFSAFMFEDETMIIDKADDRLKSYLIESSYIILREIDFMEVFK
mgnify:CR=1 FL=1